MMFESAVTSTGEGFGILLLVPLVLGVGYHIGAAVLHYFRKG